MATGKAVVARCIPATRKWEGAIDLYKSPEEFAAIVRRRLATDIDARQAAARKRLESESWMEKAKVFASIFSGRRFDEH
jgi:hypothetical protein